MPPETPTTHLEVGGEVGLGLGFRKQGTVPWLIHVTAGQTHHCIQGSCSHTVGTFSLQPPDNAEGESVLGGRGAERSLTPLQTLLTSLFH